MDYYGTPEFVGELEKVVVDGIPFELEVVVNSYDDEDFHEFMLIFYHELSNGQTLSIAFDENDVFDYGISVNIAETFGESRLWHFLGGSEENSTGTCGLEGLRKAFKLIKWFSYEILPECHTLTIYSQGKRARAYKFLERIGFIKTFSTKETEIAIYKYGDSPEIPIFLSTYTDIFRTLHNIRKYKENF